MDNIRPSIPTIDYDDFVKKFTVPLSDEDLEDLLRLVRRIRDGEPLLSDTAHSAVHMLLGFPLLREAGDREGVFRSLEIAVEANGHQVWLGHDVVLEDQGEPAWYVACHCTVDLVDEEGREFFDTADQARAVGDRHVAEHGGRWEAGGRTL